MDLGDIYGSTYQIAPGDTLRASSANSDLLAVAASSGSVSNVFLYEIRSKRRAPLTAPNLNAAAPEWSRDGIQIFFTARDAAKTSSVYRIFWDGSGLKRIRAGSNLVIGQ